MLEEQIIPRLLARSGAPAAIHLKRFHSYGLGESHVDSLLTGVEELVPDGSVKLGFRAHYPQLETKLTVRGTDMDDVRAQARRRCRREVRKRLGNFILAEDDQTLEGVVLAELTRQAAIARAGRDLHRAARSPRASRHLPGAETVFRRGIVARDRAELYDALGLAGVARRRAHPRDRRGGGAGRARADRRDPRAGGADRP